MGESRVRYSRRAREPESHEIEGASVPMIGCQRGRDSEAHPSHPEGRLFGEHSACARTKRSLGFSCARVDIAIDSDDPILALWARPLRLQAQVEFHTCGQPECPLGVTLGAVLFQFAAHTRRQCPFRLTCCGFDQLVRIGPSTLLASGRFQIYPDAIGRLALFINQLPRYGKTWPQFLEQIGLLPFTCLRVCRLK